MYSQVPPTRRPRKKKGTALIRITPRPLFFAPQQTKENLAKLLKERAAIAALWTYQYGGYDAAFDQMQDQFGSYRPRSEVSDFWLGRGNGRNGKPGPSRFQLQFTQLGQGGDEDDWDASDASMPGGMWGEGDIPVDVQMDQFADRGLGLTLPKLPFGIAAPHISIPGAVVGGILGGLIHTSKDKERLARNAEAYSRAQAGEAAFVQFLYQRSGRGPTQVIPGLPAPYNGGPIGGWATAVAKDDAWAKYQSLTGGAAPAPTVAVTMPALPPVAMQPPVIPNLPAIPVTSMPLPGAPGITVPAPPGTTMQPSGVGPITITTPGAPTPMEAGFSLPAGITPMMLVAAGGVLLLSTLMGSGGGRRRNPRRTRRRR